MHLIYPDPQWDERVRAGTALRRLANALVRHRLSASELEEIADAANVYAARAEIQPQVQRPSDYLARRYVDPAPEDGSQVVAFSDRPFSGPANPAGFEVDLRRDGDSVVSKVTFGAAFESAPGRAHGGAISAAVDDTMGYLMVVLGVAAYTAELTVRYLKGVPVETPVTFTAQAADPEGRKLPVSLTAVHDGETLIEATAVFVLIPADRLPPVEPQLGEDPRS
ncbi:MAG: acyl-coenzyme A thioesterase PaaI-like protein [Candidatus Poriferisodalaceae bacterium]|jgi:acyl-coenzyme A thioesterase PaaI-like protein